MKGTITSYGLYGGYNSLTREDSDGSFVVDGYAGTHNGFVRVYSSKTIESGDAWTVLDFIFQGRIFSYSEEKFYQPRYLVTLAKRFAEEVVQQETK